MHILTSRILDVSNSFQNTNIPIHEIVCFSSPQYYLYWFEIYYPNVPLNQVDGTFCLQYMNGMEGTKPYGIKWNRLLYAVVIILKYNKITIGHSIYIKFFSDVTLSYIIVSTYDVLNATNNDTVFPELTRVFEEHF